MSKGRRGKKERDLQDMRESLARLAPSTAYEFLCPLCRRKFTLNDDDGATEAHIIPEAAGGRLTHFICRGCNSEAGSSIDKWFGEYVRIRESGGNIFDSRIQSGSIEVDGVRLGGTIERGPAGISVTIDPRRSSPEAARQFEESFKAPKSNAILRVKYPLLSKKREVNLGALQAGYLGLVKFFGYVPVFQKSFDIVRDQLLHPASDIISKQFSAVVTSGAMLPYALGVAEIDDKVCLFSSATDILTFYPAYGSDRFYDELPKDYRNAKIRLHPFTGAAPQPGLSCALVVKDRVILFPDGLSERPVDFRVARMADVHAPLEIMRPVSVDEAREIARTDPSAVSRLEIGKPTA